MSAFQEALERPQKPRGSALDQFPTLALIVSQVTDEDRPHVLAALRGDVSAEHVAATLTDLGWPVSATTVKTYRRALRRTEMTHVRADRTAPGKAHPGTPEPAGPAD